MNLFWAIVLLAGGLLILWKAADVLVDGAVALAKKLGISPLVIGLTIVAMGTSAPEAAASIAAALKGIGDIAVGDVYGSNITNLALIGGLCALIRPIQIRLKVLRREIPVMLLVALLLWPLMHNLHLSRLEGIILLTVFSTLIILTAFESRREKLNNKKAQENQNSTAIINTKKCILFVVIGLVGLALGADITIRGAVFIGERIGLSKAVIGLTIIAFGTSLPELATCVVASYRAEHDLSIGNLVGSNIFNSLLVLGASGTIRPFGIGPRLAGVDYWILVIVSAGFACLALIGKRISRIDGIILLCAYTGYMGYVLIFTAGI